MMTRAMLVSASLMWCAQALGGTVEGMPAEDAARIQRHLPGVVQHAVEVAPLERAVDWLPLRQTTYQYTRPSGGEATIKVAETSRPPGHPVGATSGGWRMDVSDGPTRYLRLDATKSQRGVVVPTDVSTANGLLIRLNPPQPLLLEGGPHPPRDIAVKIYDVHEPSIVTHSGTVTCTWRDMGGWRVKTPAGEYDTRLVRMHYSGSVGPASVSGYTYTFYAPGVGPVAFSDSRDISAFLFFSDDTDHAGVLKAAPAR
ncbi:MAG: hypothetical protein QF733_09850 [Phycisphaerales bacterium]|jgi:hypothetical protein|nr:hypothetical protein [Phycisphaerales bacterium]